MLYQLYKLSGTSNQISMTVTQFIEFNLVISSTVCASFKFECTLLLKIKVNNKYTDLQQN